MGEHTPGPWRACCDFAGDAALKLAPDWSVDSEFGQVATVMSENCDVDSQIEADARLIAAAPELLDVCKAICEWYDDGQYDGEPSRPLSPDALIGGHEDDCEGVTIHDLLRRVIAKAVIRG